MGQIRALVVCAASAQNATLSYQQGWPHQILRHPAFDATLMNVANAGIVQRLLNESLLWREYDVILLLHSVFSNKKMFAGRLFDTLCMSRVPKIYFIGNEYKLMPEKMAFCDALGVTLLISQSEDPDIHALYRSRLKCEVTGLPNTGLDPDYFQPRVSHENRDIDIGYRSFGSLYYLGHDERTAIAEYFQINATRLDLTIDLSLNPEDRFEMTGWADFLNRCRGQLGVEAGGDCFELTDETRKRVNAYTQENPDADFSEIRDRFFADYENRVSLRIMSGRNIEAAGTKTCQILFDGEYGGYLKPDVHYIPLRKDFSNIDDVIRKFRDEEVRTQIVEDAYQLAMSELTYDRLIGRLHGLALQIV